MMPAAHLTVTLWESVPAPARPRAAAFGSVGGSGQAGPPAPAQGCRAARSSSLDEPWAARQAGFLGST